MKGDGNGWCAGPDGTKVWGKYGAAGLCLYAPDTGTFLLQHRATWTNHGNTWALPGGARDSHETVAEAALREAGEETGIRPEDVIVEHVLVTAGPYPGDEWTYSTVIARTRDGQPLKTTPNEESLELRWVGVEELTDLPLLPAFEASFPQILPHMALYKA